MISPTSDLRISATVTMGEIVELNTLQAIEKRQDLQESCLSLLLHLKRRLKNVKQ